MGALWSGQCFGTDDDAASAMWSGVGPVVSAGSPPIVSTVEHVSGTWQIVSRQAGVVLTVDDAPDVAFAACDPGDLALDGMALAWLVVLVWVAAWAISALRGPLGWR